MCEKVMKKGSGQNSFFFWQIWASAWEERCLVSYIIIISLNIKKKIDVTHTEWTCPQGCIHDCVLIIVMCFFENQAAKFNEFIRHSVLCII